MPWRVHYGKVWTYAMLDQGDGAWVNVEWLREAMTLSKKVDAKAAAIYLFSAEEHWVDLAQRMAVLGELTETEAKLIKATVEAESNGDNSTIEWDGDEVGGSGYGQVWPYWHRELIPQAMSLLGRPVLPDVLLIRAAVVNALLLYDKELSMLVTAMLVRDTWRGSGESWDKFTKAYVGEGISNEDLERRRVIWEKWRG